MLNPEFHTLNSFFARPGVSKQLIRVSSYPAWARAVPKTFPQLPAPFSPSGIPRPEFVSAAFECFSLATGFAYSISSISWSLLLYSGDTTPLDSGLMVSSKWPNPTGASASSDAERPGEVSQAFWSRIFRA